MTDTSDEDAPDQNVEEGQPAPTDGEQSEPKDARRSSPSMIQLFALLPAAAVLGVAVLYGTGALIKTAQLRDADLSVQETLPLVPIEQLLALGIGTVTSSGLIVAFWVLFIGGLTLITHRRRRQGKFSDPGTLVTVSRRTYMLLLGAFLVSWIT